MAVQNGNTIKVHYKGEYTDGTVFDSSDGREPLEFKVGAGMVVPGFDKAVVGMEMNETKKVTIPAKDAYGERSDDFVADIPRKEFPADFTANVGEKLLITLGDGVQVPVLITKINDDIVQIDGNHEMAGKDLVFTITVVEIHD